MKTGIPLEHLLECAVEAARTAGRYALDNAERRTESVKQTQHDVKLRLDLECQKMAEAAIRKHYPEHAVLGEEDETERAAPLSPDDYEWIIDPIDGTVNFSHGLRRWCCAIAVRRGDDVLAGAVYAPESDELYTATAEAASTLNGRPIRVSSVSRMAEAIVFTGLDKDVDPRMPAFSIFRNIAAHVQRTRVMGCAALDLCEVASGRGEGYFESGIYIWDIAAAGLIVRQAGGETENLGAMGKHCLRFMAGNGLINASLKRLVNPENPGLPA